MNVEMLRSVLLWCTILNYAVITFWFVIYMAAYRPLHQLWGRWFRISNEKIDTLNFALMGVYKIGVFLFNLAPLVALYIVG